MAGGKKSYLKSYVLEKGKFVIPNNEGCQKAAENSWKGLVEAKKTKLRGNIWGGGYLRGCIESVYLLKPVLIK